MPAFFQFLQIDIHQAITFLKGLVSLHCRRYIRVVLRCHQSCQAEMDRQQQDNPQQSKLRAKTTDSHGSLFTFGLGKDAHRYEDGFAGIVRTLKSYYVDQLQHHRNETL